MRTAPRAHIHAVLAMSRSDRPATVTAPGAISPAIVGTALAGTGASERRGQRAEEDPEIEPERPVANVVGVPRFLPGDVGHRALAHLPHPAEAGPHLVAEIPELSAELREVIVRERTGPDQAHVTAHDVPQLRQLVDAEPAQPRAHAGNHARIVEQLHARLPLVPGLGMRGEVPGQPLLGVG